MEVSLTATRVAGRWELTAFGHDVSERRQFEARLRAMALSDGLTGLANRRGFMEALEKAVSRHARGGPPMALLFLDLDGFKQINDDYGHHVGDLALQTFARRLEGCVRKGDTVARLGGDEFTVLAEGIVSLEQARAIADKIIEAMKPPLEGHKVPPARQHRHQPVPGAGRRVALPARGRPRDVPRQAQPRRGRRRVGVHVGRRVARLTVAESADDLVRGARLVRPALPSAHADPPWKHDGVRVVPADKLDPNTAQTPGMDRQAAITFARTGAQKLWAGTVHIHPNAKTGAHHHGPLESVIYVVKGRARMRWGDRLEFTAEAGPGDFIYVPPFVPHQEINASPTETLECVLVRSDGQAVAVNLDIEPAEPPEDVAWVDPTHPAPLITPRRTDRAPSS